ncbi:MAG: type II secretion system protein, partial [Myxococcales bacterium]|nr:type II secretion system protein [Myxococcales bacterium]
MGARRRSQAGFSLVELVVVMIVTGIVSGSVGA